VAVGTGVRIGAGVIVTVGVLLGVGVAVGVGVGLGMTVAVPVGVVAAVAGVPPAPASARATTGAVTSTALRRRKSMVPGSQRSLDDCRPNWPRASCETTLWPGYDPPTQGAP
jgi:hypothetical protein